MSNVQPDEGSIQGKGAEILLPERGNPFGGETAPAPADIYPVGAERAAPAAVTEPAAAVSEPRDLTPEELAAIFPSAHDEREPVTIETAAAGAGLSPEDMAALYPSTHADRGSAIEAELPGVRQGLDMPEGAKVLPEVSLTAPQLAVPATTTSGGAALPGVRAFGGGMQISEDVGPGVEVYKPGEALPGKDALVKLFVSDGQLVTFWTEIDAVEAEVTACGKLSLKTAEELLDRLQSARNFVMNDRANYEEAKRQVAQVKYRLKRFHESPAWRYQTIIFFYLLAMAVVLVGGFVGSDRLAALLGFNTNLDVFNLIWRTILCGGLGGITSAMFGLWKHVAWKQDYDPQHSSWYYTNPVMGLLFGGVVYMLMQAGVLTLSGGQAGAAALSPYVVYVFGWAGGWQQSVVINMVNTALKRWTPEQTDKAEDTEAATGGGELKNNTAPFPAPPK